MTDNIITLIRAKETTFFIPPWKRLWTTRIFLLTIVTERKERKDPDDECLTDVMNMGHARVQHL